ncbi:MAG: hypothetical protein IKV17_05540 [Bacteroidaceae bacterium]|nr:hypothetical protein [Bacteroidaceae bacterium]
MKRNNYIHIILSFVVLALFACTNENELLQGDGKEITVTYHPVIETTRAIGDASGIDQLVVGVYENGSKKYTTTTDWTTAQSNGISIVLIEGRQYNIIFWAQNSSNTAYTLTDDGKISVNYEDYLNGGFAKMEEMDAFYAVSNVSVGSSNAEADVILTRPFAQLNFADNTTQPVIGEHVAVLTLSDIATEFDPINGTITTASEDKTFTFSDFPNEPLSVDGNTYYYITNNYLFTPVGTTASINATLDLQKADGSSIKQIELQGVILEKNKKTNVLGAIVQQPETWSVWDGTSSDAPTIDTENRYVIKSAANVAWLAKNANTLSAGTFVLTTDIDMNKIAVGSIALPAGSTVDGGEHIIKGLNLSGALFGNATSLTVKDLAIEDVTISGASSHVGTLVNTLKGSSSFTNVSVTKSSVVTTNGAAGGMVGYIERNSAKDRNETLNVTFTGCKLNGVTVNGSASEGKFVGLLSGYDNNESLTFDAECEATDVSVADYASTYTKANNSEWAGTIDTKYNGWLGAETYRRAKVTFGGVRMAPRWDGTTATAKADLLLYNGESNKYEVYSPFDLAGVRKATASPAALYLMENVDMFGQGVDGEYFVHSNFTKSAFNSTDDNKFNAFSSIALLEGNNNGIYNLALNSQGSDRYAFILSGNNGDIHRNTSFHNCCTVVPHIVGTDDGQTVDKSYGATVVLSVGGATYTMDNVHAYGCKVFALQKTAILAGRLVSTTKATINNCSVNNCYIENYKCQEHKELFEESIVSAEFYSYGEIGALTGFINYNATITNCSVNNTEINAYGQSDQKGNIANFIKAGIIPGRHINQFIGDIRSKEGYTVSVSDCSVSGNSYGQDSHSHSKGTSISVIGEAYCLGAKIIFIGQKGDKKGTVKVKNITIDGTKKFTSETSVTLQELM